MAIFDSESLYITCSTDAIERLARLKQIIISLDTQMIVAAGDVNIADYSLHDGQVIIRTAYRDPTTIAKAIERFELIYNRLANKCNGTSIISLRDARALNLLQRY